MDIKCIDDVFCIKQWNGSLKCHTVFMFKSRSKMKDTSMSSMFVYRYIFINYSSLVMVGLFTALVGVLL